MKINWEKLKLRPIITISAEAATVLSLILTWIMFKQVGNAAPSTSSGVLFSNPLLIGIMVVNGLMFIFVSVTITRSVFVFISGKTYQLGKNFEVFIKSDSHYLLDMKKSDATAEGALITKTRKSIKTIDENKAFDQDVYYMLLYTLFHTADGNINVVSILDDSEWVDTPEEDEFLRVNLAVAGRRIHLNRIFIVKKSEVKEKLDTKSIQSFIAADHTYIHLFVVFYDKLPRSIVNDIGSGFIDFHGFAIACDIFSDNEIRGFLKFEAKEVERYNRIYMRLNEYYQPLNDAFVRKYFG